MDLPWELDIKRLSNEVVRREALVAWGGAPAAAAAAAACTDSLLSLSGFSLLSFDDDNNNNLDLLSLTPVAAAAAAAAVAWPAAAALAVAVGQPSLLTTNPAGLFFCFLLLTVCEEVLLLPATPVSPLAPLAGSSLAGGGVESAVPALLLSWLVWLVSSARLVRTSSYSITPWGRGGFVRILYFDR